jgi:hypothetical protein
MTPVIIFKIIHTNVKVLSMYRSKFVPFFPAHIYESSVQRCVQCLKLQSIKLNNVWKKLKFNVITK